MKKWFRLPLQEKLKYLTFSAGAVVFFVHCSQYAGSFFRTWRLWKYFKEIIPRSLAFWTSMDEESAAFDRFIQEQF